jgi:glycosyltransferase involved in cell wall biosynthesis
MLPPIGSRSDGGPFVPDAGSDPLQLGRLLADKGIDLTTLVPGPWPINPFGRSHSLLRGLDPVRSLRVLLRERHHDLVISIMEGPAVPLLLLRRLAGFTTPILLWDIAPSETWRLRRRLLDFVVPRIDGLLVLSSIQPGYIARRWSPSVPVTVVGHHIDTAFYHPLDDGPGSYILSVGEDVGRDFPTLLAAMDGVSAELVLRSSLDPMPGLRRVPNLRWMRDRISEPDLRSLYAGARFVVVPLMNTLNASGVSTILEAGAMGKATIVSASAAMDDFVIADETCLRVPCHDPAALRAAIQRLLNEPDTCARLGANARRFIVERCSRDAFAGRFATAIRSAVR